MYLEAARMADANDTGICDAVHNVEPKVGMDSRTHREGLRRALLVRRYVQPLKRG
jgi:hypothetical protein